MVVQLQKGTGIFGCHAYSVLSDGNLSLGMDRKGQEIKPVPLPGDKAWMAPVPGTAENVWHNTNVFARAWNWLLQDGTFRKHDWSVKVDPDTVFMPGVLQRQLRVKYFWLNPDSPMYLLNCGQFNSLQGPLEIFSRAASSKFFSNIGSCMAALDWKSWGEDWFVANCMDFLGVQKQWAVDLLNDMYCGRSYLEEFKKNGPTCKDGKASFHPYKTTADMQKCLAQAMK